MRALAAVAVALAGAGTAAPATAAEAIPGERWCDGRPLDRVVFAGNRVTRAEVLARELGIRPGDTCEPRIVIGGLAPLRNLGLFREVRPELELDSRGALTLRYTVRERLFFIGLPRVARTTDGELRAGVSLEWNNFLGRLHELEIRGEWRQEDDGRGHEGVVGRIDYEVPRLLGTPYGFGLRLRAERRGTDFSRDGVEYGRGRRRALGLGLGLSRWLDGGAVRGTRVFVGAAVEHREHEIESGDAGPALEGLDLNFRAGLERRSLRRDRWRRTGRAWGASVGFASEALGSDFSWHRVDAWASAYLPLGTGLTNLNVRGVVGASDGAPFGERFYSVGGGERLRGPDKGTREGDVQALLNTELLFGLVSRPAVRWVLFADVGNAWAADEIDPRTLDWGAGVGLRWKVEAINDTDLRVDLAWDHARGRVRPYLATKLTF